MNDFLKMDIFFIVATLVTLVVGILLAVFLFYAIRVVKTADRLGTMVEKEVRVLKGDFDEVRLQAKREAGQLLALITTVRKVVTRFIAPKPPRD